MSVGHRAIVFGSSGTLGSACVSELERVGVSVTCVSHKVVAARSDGMSPAWLNDLGANSVDQVIWVHGKNAAGGIANAKIVDVEDLFEANVLFIIRTLRDMLDAGVLKRPSRLVIVSSIWDSVARQEKLAYVVSKSAVAGLVRSLAADLGSLGVAVNAVAPGVIDTPMTRANLSTGQIDGFVGATPQESLCTPDDVARVVRWLASDDSAGVNSETVRVDGGWSEVRYV